MKRYRAILLFSVILVLVIGPFSKISANQTNKEGTGDDEIREIIDGMTLEEKIGQLFIVHVYGQTPTDSDYEEINLRNNRGGKNFQEVIENYHVGGIIYFNWTDNIGMPLDAVQVNSLSNGLQQIAMDQSAEIPLFISTDQEGGIVQRVTSPGTVFPGNMALGATRSEAYASRTGSILGNELTSLGVNMNFAPTVDVNMNPENPVIGVRSFGEDPDLVSKLGAAQINAYQDQNVIASAKHFPGHGDTAVDSHYGLPIIDHDLETLHEVDLKPFKEAIDNGIQSIMTGHIVVPALDDSGLPATLSKPILTDLLREELGFEGLIITDSLGMSGANVVPPERVPVEAFKAGADILLNPPNVEVAFNSMLEAVETGEISVERLEASVHRILAAKMNNGLFNDPYTDPGAIESIGSSDHLNAAQEMADRSVTLVKNSDDVLPFQSSDSVFVTGPSMAKPDRLTDLLMDQGIHVEGFSTAASPTEEEINEAVARAEEADKVLVTTYTANTNEQQQQFVQALEDTGKPVIVSAHRNPYDVMAFPEVEGYLSTYSYMDVSINAVANVLTGELNPFGKLPVTIPDMYEIGHSIDYIDTELSADGMKELAAELASQGEFSSDVERKLSLHLTAVSRFERKQAADKVVKHMEGFQDLIQHQLANNAISDKAFSYLDTEAIHLIETWNEND
ncbi:hypothetical protein M948_03055 [Virgibacillus sp. CM-4]|uniref:glycoside hydrolase family 3 protein n=1 Tax=Virgibacillus sp. CM-4 TaxID=1354277 RepID=UPI0003887E79|nr:glycoside hydrolase family 3 protein [Virgibacillus sp. CM-4]EQB37542.1 hypothetical protein M948_03055 [Virgibacillus sp. CM-4]